MARACLSVLTCLLSAFCRFIALVNSATSVASRRHPPHCCVQIVVVVVIIIMIVVCCCWVRVCFCFCPPPLLLLGTLVNQASPVCFCLSLCSHPSSSSVVFVCVLTSIFISAQVERALASIWISP
jgi:RsiW-degrading membrane proteinase PrsW (M82 family)